MIFATGSAEKSEASTIIRSLPLRAGSYTYPRYQPLLSSAARLSDGGHLGALGHRRNRQAPKITVIRTARHCSTPCIEQTTPGAVVLTQVEATVLPSTLHHDSLRYIVEVSGAHTVLPDEG
jgi:hypothetical protein